MRIDYIQVSNVLSFAYVPNVADACRITFDNGLNIIIGENGAGKSTALEIINFVFRRIIFRELVVEQEILDQRYVQTEIGLRQALTLRKQATSDRFRLEPN